MSNFEHLWSYGCRAITCPYHHRKPCPHCAYAIRKYKNAQLTKELRIEKEQVTKLDIEGTL